MPKNKSKNKSKKIVPIDDEEEITMKSFMPIRDDFDWSKFNYPIESFHNQEGENDEQGWDGYLL